MIYVFDIDGTLADCSHRLHLIKQEPPNWPAFFAACSEDAVIADVASLARVLHGAGNNICMVTGRSDECEEATLHWLLENNIPFTCVYMRKKGDHRPDHEVKSELIDQLMEDWREHGKPVAIFEDRKRVVDMYRARGLRVFQVAEGKF